MFSCCLIQIISYFRLSFKVMAKIEINYELGITNYEKFYFDCTKCPAGCMKHYLNTSSELRVLVQCKLNFSF